MIIKRLSVKNFRNIKNADFSFSEKTNIIGGNNAQGKTNLMEAMSCAVEKSFRTNKAVEMLPDNGGDSEIDLSFMVDAHPDKMNTLSCKIREGGIERKINDIGYKDGIKLYPQLKTIVFIPEDLYIVKGKPESRRELTDDTADMMNKVHRNMTGNYVKALKQKNTFITSMNQKKMTRSDHIQLEIWNEEVAKAGVNVMCGRLRYFAVLSRYANEFYGMLNNNNEVLRMEYQSTIMEDIPFKLEDAKLMFDTYMKKLDGIAEKEVVMGHTLIGVHRDDVNFYINDKPAKEQASQGQIRSIAIALRLAQAKMFAEKWGEAPVIVLDDVLSELDEARRGFILSHIVDSQMFITGCNKNDFLGIKEARYWVADGGKFVEQ